MAGNLLAFELYIIQVENFPKEVCSGLEECPVYIPVACRQRLVTWRPALVSPEPLVHLHYPTRIIHTTTNTDITGRTVVHAMC